MAQPDLVCHGGFVGRIVGWVDDEPIVRTLASKLVRRKGGELHAFVDHATLLEAARETAFDVVVLQPSDNVPAMEVLAVLRGSNPSMRILLASANPSDVMAGRGIDVAAFDAYLPKPFSGEELIGAVWSDRR